MVRLARAKEKMRELLERRDGPAIRDTLLWFALYWLPASAVSCSGAPGGPSFRSRIYGVLYASTSDSRWHESSHGTAFKTDWMNNALYEIASFMVLRESTRWRWSHTRHHSDTIIVGRDPEIAVPRPPNLPDLRSRTSSTSMARAQISSDTCSCTAPGAHAGRKDLHPGIGVRQSRHLRRASTSLIYAGVIGLAICHRQHPAADVHRPAQPSTAAG